MATELREPNTTLWKVLKVFFIIFNILTLILAIYQIFAVIELATVARVGIFNDDQNKALVPHSNNQFNIKHEDGSKTNTTSNLMRVSTNVEDDSKTTTVLSIVQVNNEYSRSNYPDSSQPDPQESAKKLIKLLATIAIALTVPSILIEIGYAIVGFIGISKLNLGCLYAYFVLVIIGFFFNLGAVFVGTSPLFVPQIFIIMTTFMLIRELKRENDPCRQVPTMVTVINPGVSVQYPPNTYSSTAPYSSTTASFPPHGYSEKSQVSS